MSATLISALLFFTAYLNFLLFLYILLLYQKHYSVKKALNDLSKCQQFLDLEWKKYRQAIQDDKPLEQVKQIHLHIKELQMECNEMMWRVKNLRWRN